MIRKVGLIALGHSSVSDGIPGVSAGLPDHVQIIGCGALDGLHDEEIRALAPQEGEHLIVLKAEPGIEAPVAYHHILPLVQKRVHWLEAQGAELIAVLCGADWASLTSKKLLINPGAIFPQLAVALARGKKLGLVLPSIHQVATSEQRYCSMGADAVATHITLYDGTVQEETQAAAEFFVEQGVDLIWLPCMAMTRDIQTEMRNLTDRPVVLAQSMLSQVIGEAVG